MPGDGLVRFVNEGRKKILSLSFINSASLAAKSTSSKVYDLAMLRAPLGPRTHRFFYDLLS